MERNPADLLTRGVSAFELIKSSEWLQGPSNLDDLELLDSNLEELNHEDIDLSLEKVRKCNPLLLHLHETQGLIDFKRFSQLPKVIKVMGWVLRFVNNLKLATKRETLNRTKSLESSELKAANVSMSKIVQR